MYSHVWLINLILIEHRVVAVRVEDDSDQTLVDVAAKKLQILKNLDASQTSSKTDTNNLKISVTDSVSDQKCEIRCRSLSLSLSLSLCGF